MPFQPPAQKVVATPKGKQQQTIASKQVQATKPTQEPLRVDVRQEHAQSVQTMRELVTNLASSLFYLRDIISDDNFVANSIAVPQRLKSNGAITPATQLPVMQLRRHYSDEADDALNWLDYGITEALNKGYLKSLIIFVYLKEDTRNRALEAYTFNFNYGAKKVDAEGNVVEGMDRLRVTPEGPSNKDAFGQSARRLLREACRAVSGLAKFPKDVMFDFKLFFTEETPEDFQPPAFKADDGGETFLATHGADEVPFTFDAETCANTGLHGVSLQIASITHWLPEQPEVEGDPRASENEQLEVHKAAERDHQMAVEEDDADRDILWPMEQAIYGKVGSNALSSQLESVTIQPSEASAFTHPTGQLLRDGTIQAIPKDKVRWSDDPEQLVRVRRRATPIQDRKAFGGPNKTLYDPWNRATQDNSQKETQDDQQTSQNYTQLASQVLPRAVSAQQESATQQEPASDVEMDIELDVDHRDDEEEREQETLVDPVDESPASQQSASDNEDDRDKDGDFNIKAVKPSPLPMLPKKTVTKKKAPSLNTSKKTSKRPTAMQISTPFQPKPKPRPKKVTTDAVKSAATKSQKTPKAKQPAAAKSTAIGNVKANGGRVAKEPNLNRRAPVTLAQMGPDPTQSDIDDPDDFANPTPREPLFLLTQDTQIQSQTQPSQPGPMHHQQTAPSRGRHHPYSRPPSAGPSSHVGGLPVPQTHMRRIRSSRGIRGIDPKELATTLTTIIEE